MTQKNPDFEKLFRSVITPEKWRAFRQEQVAEVAGDIDRAKCEKFSDYMTDNFISTCNDKEIAGRFQNWEQTSDSEKLKLASDIVRIFLKKVKFDIETRRVPIYNPNQSECYNTNDKSDKNTIEGVSQFPTISVKPMPNDKIDDTSMMYVSHDKDLCVNITHQTYQKSASAFLMDLRHELTHVIDMFIPEISPLDPKVREKAIQFYVGAKENSELYSKNPLELNANMKRKEYGQCIDAMLTMQAMNQNRRQNMNFMGMLGRGLGR